MTELTHQVIKDALESLEFHTKAIINGKAVDSVSGETFPAENPATGEIFTHIALCGEADVELAVKGAREVFERGDWSCMAPADRRRIMVKFADLIDEHALELALLEVIEAGKPVSETLNTDIHETSECIRWHAEATDKIYDQVCPTGRDNLGMIIREPIGVVGAVLPWNFPAQMAAWKLGPVLSMGNSIIIKPAEITSLSTIRLAELALEAGIPAGVFNVVSGKGSVIGKALGEHMDVDCCAFTGSTGVGRKFLEYAAQSNLKRIVLELGGKSPQIVMPDVSDLAATAEHVVSAAFWNMGENCSAGSRLLVHESLKEPLLEEVLKVMEGWKLGDPLDPEVMLGSMIEKKHMEKVLSYIEKGLEEGAELRLGGKQVLQETGGYFVEPTIFDNVTNDMTIAREEIFGPVLGVITFKTEEEAIRLANETEYGLASSLHTENVHVANRMARAIKAGTVSINCFSEGDSTAPFGGFKQSGFGGRDKSLAAHDQYAELKTVWYENR